MAAVGGDGAYDRHKVFDALATPPSGPPIQPIIALRKDAIIQQHGNCKAPPLARDEILRGDATKRTQGLETRVAIIDVRWPAPLSISTSSAVKEPGQQVESRIGCAILNRMIHLGKLGADRKKKLTKKQHAKTIPAI